MPRRSIDIEVPVEYLGILDEEGKVDEELEPDLPDDLLEGMHRSMVLAREFDRRLLRLQRSGRIGTFAPVEGQEAQVGAAAAIETTDWMVPSFRETAALIHRGASLENFILYNAGFNEGAAVPEDSRDLPIAIPVASQLTHAAGIAHASKHRGDGNVVLTFFGDGATSGGDFHEAMNYAGTFELPVVFACQNNQWAISVPREEQTAAKTLAQKAIGYGFPGIQVDGNDVLAVHQATTEAVERARDGAGPTMIEMVTYRLNVHTTADDPSKYRSKEEEETWRERDPIPRFEGYLRDRGVLDDEALASLGEEIEEQIDQAWEQAKSRMEDLRDEPLVMFDHMYEEMPPHLEAQREHLADALKEASDA